MNRVELHGRASVQHHRDRLTCLDKSGKHIELGLGERYVRPVSALHFVFFREPAEEYYRVACSRFFNILGV
jgi:hypothetical protein